MKNWIDADNVPIPDRVPVHILVLDPVAEFLAVSVDDHVMMFESKNNDIIIACVNCPHRTFRKITHWRFE